MTFEEWFEEANKENEVDKVQTRDAYSVGFNEGSKQAYEDYKYFVQSAKRVLAYSNKAKASIPWGMLPLLKMLEETLEQVGKKHE